MRETSESTPLSAGSDLAGDIASRVLQGLSQQRKDRQDRGSGDERFGKALRSTRERDGLTQQEFAARCGVHYTTIGKIETGDRGMTAETLAKILWASDAGFQNWALRYLATGKTDG